MNDSDVLNSVQGELAKTIVDAFVENCLVNKSKQQQTSEKIAAGKMKQEDWSLLIELAEKPETQEDQNDA